MSNWFKNKWDWFWNGETKTVSIDTPIRGMGFIPIGDGQIAKLVGSGDYQKALQLADALAAIILRCAEAFSNGCFEVLNRSTQNYTRGQYKEWDRLFEKPNPRQSRIQFLQQLYIFTKSKGYCYGIPIYPAGFKDRPSALFLLPPWCVEVELIDKNKKPYEYQEGEPMRRVFFTYGGTRTELKEEELILFTDNTVNTNEDTWLPEPIINTLGYKINIYASADDATLSIQQKRGPLGIFSNKAKDPGGHVPMTDDEKRDLQEDINGYGALSDQKKFIVTTSNLEWIKVQADLKDLMLDENQLKAVKAMCFVLGYPFPLTPFSDQSTYNNIQQAGKDLYQQTIIPQAKNLIEQLNEGLKTPEQNIEIKVNYDDVYVFQQSNKDKGEGLKALNDAWKILWDNGIATRNQWLEALGMDTVKGNELFDKYKFELTPEQLGIVMPEEKPTKQNGTSGTT